jgi:hypothetical protein
MNTFIEFHRFENPIILKIFCILIFIIIAFRKSFKNITLVFFLELSNHEYKFETQLKKNS